MWRLQRARPSATTQRPFGLSLTCCGGDCKQSAYRRGNLSMVVLRWLDCPLEPTKSKVLETAAAYAGKVANVGPFRRPDPQPCVPHRVTLVPAMCRSAILCCVITDGAPWNSPRNSSALSWPHSWWISNFKTDVLADEGLYDHPVASELSASAFASTSSAATRASAPSPSQSSSTT